MFFIKKFDWTKNISNQNRIRNSKSNSLEHFELFIKLKNKLLNSNYQKIKNL